MKIAPLIGFPGRKLTKTTIKENLQNADVQLNTLLAIEKEFSPDIIFVFMDLSVEAQAIGLKVDFPEDDSPNVIEHPVHNEDMLRKYEKLNFNEIFETSRMRLFTDVVRNFKKQSSTELSAYVIGPFSFAGLMMDATSLMLAVITEPDFVSRTLNFTTNIVTEYAKRLTAAGADYITILEPTAVMLSPTQFDEIVAPQISAVTNNITVPSVLHICGDTTHLFEGMSKLDSVFGLSLDSDIDLRDAYEKTQKVVIGNINPVMVARACKEHILTEINARVEKMSGISNFILSTGCDLPPETPLENITLFRKAYSEGKLKQTA